MNKKDQNKIINDFFDRIDKIRDIDVKNESKNILINPRAYFQKHLNGMDGWVMILAKMEVYFKVRETDHHGMTHKEDALNLIKRLSVSGYIDILLEFYRYALEIVNFLMEDSTNIMLDSYNEKKIDHILLDKIMSCINSLKDTMARDKQDISKAIELGLEEQQRINEIPPNSFLGT